MNFFLIYILIRIITAETFYTVYSPNNDYPRSLIINNNDVIVLGGMNNGSFHKFNNNGQLIEKKESFIQYDYYSTAITFQSEPPKFALRKTLSILTFFDEEKIFENIEYNTNTDGFKLVFEPLINDNILIGTISEKDVDDSLITLAIYSYKEKSIIHQETLKSTNLFISCVQIPINKMIVCQYVLYDCHEYYRTYEEDLTPIKNNEIVFNSDCSFDKVISLGSDLIIFTFMTMNTFAFRIFQTDINFNMKLVSHDVTTGKDEYIGLTDCKKDISYNDAVTFSEKSFVLSCRHYQNREYYHKISIVNVEGTNNVTIITYNIIADAPLGKNFTFAQFGDNFLGVFYHLGNDNVYEIFEFPSCSNFTFSIYINSDSENFNIGNYIKKGSRDESSDELKMYFYEWDTSKGIIMYQSSQEKVESNKASVLDDIVFHSFDTDTTINIKFAGYNHYNKLGQYCFITITIMPCYKTCFTCNAEGNEDDNKCTSCRTGYYPIEDIPNKCVSSLNGYYLDTNTFRHCYSSCATCTSKGNEDIHNCETCITDKYFYGSTKNCIDKRDGLYLDSDNKLQDCYSSCVTCEIGGNSINNNCLTCKEGIDRIANGEYYNCMECPEGTKYFNQSCLPICEEGTIDKGYYCLNCKTKLLCYIEGDSDCVNKEEINEGYYLADSSKNYYKKCNENCRECETTSTNCISCKDDIPILYNAQCFSQCPIVQGVQLYYMDNTCIDKCPNYLYQNEASLTCENCKEDNGKFKKINVNQCIETPEEGYHILMDAYNYYDMCYPSCSECYEITKNDNDQQCSKCKADYYFELSPSTNCIDDCGKYLVSDSTQRKCINCKETFNYKYVKENNCVLTQPQNSLIIDIGTNTFDYCYKNCETCSAISFDENDQKCLTCKASTYLQYKSFNCKETCGDSYFQDDSTRKCINCNDNQQFKYIDENLCIQSRPDNSYVIDEKFGLLGHCYTLCATCDKEGNDQEHNCKTCNNGYYLEYKGSNCVSTCEANLVAQNGKCINCKDNTDGKNYKYEFSNECIYKPTVPFTYVDESYGVIRNCNTNCAKCIINDSSVLCLQCVTGTYMLYNTDICSPSCSHDDIPDDYYGKNDLTLKCEKCSIDNKYKTLSSHSCFTPSSPFFITNSDYNIIEYCYSTCKTCSSSSKCLTCLDDYFMEKDDLGNDSGICSKCHYHCATCAKGANSTNENCLTCNFILYNNKGNCVQDCPHLIAKDESTHQCIDCKETKSFLDIFNRKCINALPDKHYKYKDDFVIYKCNLDCSVEYTGLDIQDEQKAFCENENIIHRCNSMIDIDDDLKVHFTIIEEKNEKIIIFNQSSFDTQNEILETLKQSIEEAIKTNITQALLDINLLHQYIRTISDCDSNFKNENLKYALHILTLVIEEHSFNVDMINFITTLSLSVYNTITTYHNDIADKDIITISNFLLDIINRGMPHFIINSTSLNQHQWIQEDVSSITGSSISRLINITNSLSATSSYDKEEYKTNETYRFYNSFDFSDTKRTLKKVIEDFSYMTALFEESDVNSFKEISFVSQSLSKINEEGYLNKEISLSTKHCDEYDKMSKQMKTQKLTFKVCFSYENLIEMYPTAKKVSVIEYKEYPFLNKEIFDFYKEMHPKFHSIIIRDENANVLNVTHLNESIVIVTKKIYEDTVNCIYYNETAKQFEGNNCTSVIKGDYVICECNHLTDFSLSKYNPLLLLKDIARLFTQARIINSFAQFKLLTFSNAIVLYVISGILIVYFILLYFTLQKDKRGSIAISIVNANPSGCCEEDEKEEEIKELSNKINKKLNQNDSSVIIELEQIDNTTLSQHRKNSSIPFTLQKPKDDEKQLNPSNSSTNSHFKVYYILFKTFFLKDYWFCTFINNEDDISKTNILTIFVIHLIAALSVCSIFTECSSEEESSLYNNRDLAVSIATILILEIPFTIFELLLQKTKVNIRETNHRGAIAARTMYRYVLVYVMFVAIFAFGTINTTWISMDSMQNGFECNFIKDFFLSIIFDCFIYQVVILMLKALIYAIIIRGKKKSCIRAVLLCVISSLPWIFNLSG